jgi:hypothetical protein
MTNKERMLNILEDTVNYYSEDTSRRALDKHYNCRFQTVDGKMCAVGRYLKPITDWTKIYSAYTYQDLINEYPDCMTEQGLPTSFWLDLQKLHDINSYWNKYIGKGLTLEGDKFIEKIKDNINNGYYGN